jgi:hypothetical protein
MNRKINLQSCDAPFLANAISAMKFYHLSTSIPALIALATLRNLGLLSPAERLVAPPPAVDRVNVCASQSRTSVGTASASTLLSSSSSSSASKPVLWTKQKFKKKQGKYSSATQFLDYVAKYVMLVIIFVLILR